MPKPIYLTKSSHDWRRKRDKGEAAHRPPWRGVHDEHGAEESRDAVASRQVSGARVTRDEVIFLASQLAVMVETGVTLPEALDAIADQTQEPALKEVVEDLSMQVKGGVSFSGALKRHPRAFSPLLVALMRASEVSGTMGTMLHRACAYLSQERHTIKQIKGAMIYPICMLCFCTLVVIGLLIFILPRFEKIYAGKGAILPAPTRVMLSVSHGLVDYWYVALALVAILTVGAIFYFRSDRGRCFLDTFRIRMPVMGRMYRKAYLARSLRTMSTMISTGVSLLEGLEITADVVGNHHYAEIWKAVSEQAREGCAVSEELAKHPLIPCTVTRMIAAGERSGQLAHVMDRVAEFCEADVRTAIKSVTSLVEPAMIVIMGLIIGGIAMALLLPVFTMSRLVH